ncbi:MAG TPA: M12 family metallo-peptidase [Steroidobacteraceae bacterium]|nr:M12 family metallo-peptidase [Steroidobacteraceae bacterium]
MENRAFGALATALLLCCAYASAALAEPLRVLYAEPFQAQSPSTPGAQKAGPANLRVQAFGRRFELELEDNSRLLRATSAATRARFGAIKVLKGTIKDAPGSWVRLTLTQGRYSGAFWDGSELYAIAPRETLNEALTVPLAAASTAIYRLSDTQGGLFDGTCGVAGSAPSTASPTAKFQSLIRELRAAADSAFAAAPREIEIAMIGDFEFTNRFGASAAQAMLDRMNTVDGIFSTQVGVSTVPTDFITFPANTDPFTSSEPSELLSQVGTYRNATPTVRNRGLAHLLTGRQLDGNIIGIAYIGAVCKARFGAGLTEVSSFIDSPLVMAHEIGHNFGAPHDAETGSPCASTPANFLMAPELNFSSQFSACSLQQIQTSIQGAPCITATANRDLAVTAPADELQAVIGQPFDYLVDVTSVGDVGTLNGVLTVQLPGSAVVVNSASMPDATCEVDFSLVRCQLPDLAPTQSRRLTLQLVPQLSGDFSFANSVVSTGDVNPANDTRTLTVHVALATDLAVKVTPEELTVTTGDTFELTYEVSATGVLPLSGMRADISAGLLTATSVTVDSGSCSNTSPQFVTCDLGTIAAGATRHIRVQWTGQSAGTAFGTISASTADFSISRGASFRVTVQAERDVAIFAPESFKRVAIGADAVWSVDVRSQGVRTVDDVHVRLSATGPQVAISVDPPLDASCTLVTDALDCALGAMAPQTMQTIQFRTSANVEGTATIHAQVALATPDNQPGNDGLGLFLDVRVGDEISLLGVSVPAAFDERPSSVSGTLFALGANASENVRVHLTLPAGFVAQSATLAGQSCALTAANVVNCSLARIEPVSTANLTVLFVAPQPGMYAGSIEVSADSDTDPSNNSQALTFEVLPNVDGQLTAATPPDRVRSDMPADLVFTIDTNKYALPDARLDFSWFGAVDQFSATAPGAICGSSPGGYSCQWSSIAANTNVQIAVRVRSSIDTGVSISASLSAAADTDIFNNSAFLTFLFVVPGDVAVTVTQPLVTANLNQMIALPGVDLLVLTPVQNPFVELTFDFSRLEVMSLPNGSCFQTTVLRCSLSGMGPPGTYSFNLQVVPRGGVGSVPISIRVGAFNDFNTANDLQTMTLTIVDPTPPPPPPPPPSGNSGGGGGGSMDWLLAALLFLMWHHRRARSGVHR